MKKEMVLVFNLCMTKIILSKMNWIEHRKKGKNTFSIIKKVDFGEFKLVKILEM